MRPPSAQGLLMVDTDVLIDDLRDQPEAVTVEENTEQALATSVLTVAEPDAGATLVTLNRPHFPMLTEVLVPYAKG